MRGRNGQRRGSQASVQVAGGGTGLDCVCAWRRRDEQGDCSSCLQRSRQCLLRRLLRVCQCDVCPDIMRRLLDAAGSVLTALRQHSELCCVHQQSCPGRRCSRGGVGGPRCRRAGCERNGCPPRRVPGTGNTVTDVQSCGAAFLLRKQRSSTSV